MRTVLLAICFLGLVSPALADTWKVNANTWAIQIPPNTTYTVGYQRISKATGQALGSGQSTTGTTTGTGTTITYNAPNMTDSQDFRAEFGFWGGGGWRKLKWVNSYNYSTNPNGGTSNGGLNSGGYNDNDDMVDANGNPVDANGNQVPAEGYKETTKITNNDNTPMIVRVTLKDSNGNILSQRQITVPPNSSMNVVNKLDQPFVASYDKATYYDPDTGGGAGWEPLGTGHQASSSAGGGGYGSGGSTSATATPNPSTTPTATPSETMPGSGGGVLESNEAARHKELMKELQRGTTMQKTGVDTAHADATANGQKGDLANSLLRGIKSGIESLTGNGNGNGDGEGISKDEVREAMETAINNTANAGRGVGGHDAQLDGAAADSDTVAGKFGEIKNSINGNVTALQGAVNALGLGRAYGVDGWTWHISLGDFGSYDLDVEEMFGWGMDLIRQVALWIMSLEFVVQYAYILRKALVG